ncbi:hypothetical protein XENTR_v10017103 [Xenopus tropicalis]|nr:hypothetical protein XENTR_v10017103 [Xenopus tropicalis]
MEVKKLMRKSLQPARPVRRVVMHKGPMFPTGPMAPSVLKNLSLKQEKLCRATSLDSEPLFMLNIRTEFTDYLIHDIEKHLDMWCSISNHDKPEEESVLPIQAKAPQPKPKKGI